MSDVNVLQSLYIAEVNLETTMTRRVTRLHTLETGNFELCFELASRPRHVMLKQRDGNTYNDIAQFGFKCNIDCAEYKAPSMMLHSIRFITPGRLMKELGDIYSEEYLAGEISELLSSSI